LKSLVNDENLKRNNGISKSSLEVNNQPVLTAHIISNNNQSNNSSSNKHGLEKSSSTMSATKMQKSLFESAQRLKQKEFKYDANPSIRRCSLSLFKVGWLAFSVAKSNPRHIVR
jgi:hypothetical protein